MLTDASAKMAERVYAKKSAEGQAAHAEAQELMSQQKQMKVLWMLSLKKLKKIKNNRS